MQLNRPLKIFNIIYLILKLVINVNYEFQLQLGKYSGRYIKNIKITSTI